jgi:hypothetical protein
MLDDKNMVKDHINEVNKILATVEKISEKELQKNSWDIGVIGRSYYVVGAHMCRVIDESEGKKRLTRTLLEGPESFLELYNSLASDEARIVY